ncbi:hypothetical protein JCM10207_007684 [Rhodosporidiobolus poonsookiae]
MEQDELFEDLLALNASLTDGELRWDDEDEQRQWQGVLDGGEELHDDLPLPHLSLTLAPGVDLLVEYRSSAGPDLSLHALVLQREQQELLAEEVDRLREKNETEWEHLPVFTAFTALKEWLAANPLVSSRRSAPKPPSSPPRPRPSGPLQLKVVLLWSHHLLATSKRKDIVTWSTELELWGFSKPGYPGCIIIEGLCDRVDEFVYRIKQLQWKALQVRCEQDGPSVTPPEEVPPAEAATWVVRHRSQLGPVISTSPSDKICVREVEGLNDVGEYMRRAGLYEVFLTALKLNK